MKYLLIQLILTVTLLNGLVASEIECPVNETTILPDPEDCNKYWECINGSGYQFACPGDLLWNQELLKCDYPGNVNCGSTWFPSSTTDNFTPNPLCPYPSDDIVFFPDPDDCAKYFECYEGVLTEFTCPDGLLWNQEYETCDFSHNVECGGTTGPPQTTGTSVTPNPFCPYPSEELTFLPDPDDCAKFFKCYQGVLTVSECSYGLLWNEDLKACDLPANVDCDGRPTDIPSTTTLMSETTEK